MKKIIIVNNNMHIGGVQKSLYNLLWNIDLEYRYDVTLLLFSKNGYYLENLPNKIKVVECGKPFHYMGESQNFFKKNLFDYVIRGFLAVLSRLFGRDKAIKLMCLFQPKLDEKYDCAISFLHNGKRNSFYGGVQEYVLNCVNADKKIAFLHCDYSNCGANHIYNNRMLSKFDAIAACSDGCRKVFSSSVRDLAAKCITVRNCHLYNEIRKMANEKPYVYDTSFINVVSVSRLSSEKGLERAINAIFHCVNSKILIKLHIIGDGPMYKKLASIVEELNISENVVFYGEKSNPYRYMKNADLLLMSSYHEAAPMVIDESRCLGLPVLTTKTTSSKDMVEDLNCGWVCENSQEALNEALFTITSNNDIIFELKTRLLNSPVDNCIGLSQFSTLVES